MLINQMSDLHLEFDPHYLVKNKCKADVLMLNGDIFVVAEFLRKETSTKYFIRLAFDKFLSTISKEYEHVLICMGNHEYYNGNIGTSAKILREVLRPYNNIHLLDNQYIDIDGVRFIGATLWTNCNGGDPLTCHTLSAYMNDYKSIYKGKYKLRTDDTIRMHVESKQFISESCNTSNKVVVMTHHAPSFASVHPRYNNEFYMNGGYASNLDYLISELNVSLWTHGHMHDNFDYTIGKTRIVCNPKGYRDQNVSFNINNILEI